MKIAMPTGPVIKPSCSATRGSKKMAQVQPRLRGEEWKACVQFEGLMIGQMLQMMHKFERNRGVIAVGAGEELFWRQYCAAVGRQVAQASPLGIARMLYQALTRARPGAGEISCNLEPGAGCR